MLESRLQADLKQAMLARDELLVGTLKMIKSALTYRAIELAQRDSGLGDEQVLQVLQKESKKRADAAEAYERASNLAAADSERQEKAIIDAYLPDQMDDEALRLVVDEVAATFENLGQKDMGRLIGAVKQRVGMSADGGRIAKSVTEVFSRAAE